MSIYTIYIYIWSQPPGCIGYGHARFPDISLFFVFSCSPLCLLVTILEYIPPLSLYWFILLFAAEFLYVQK